MSDDVLPQKRCSKCGELRPLDLFARNKRAKDGLDNRCKVCETARYLANAEVVRARANAYRKANVEHVREVKKKYSDTHREEKSAYDRSRYEIKGDEIRAKQKAYRQANPELIRERKKKHYLANREKILAYLHAWQVANTEYLRYKHHAYYIEHAEKIKASVKRWAAANPEKIRQYKRNYRAANTEKVRERHRIYREANREKIKAWQRAYYAAYPHKAVLKRHRRRAQILGNGGTFTLEEYIAMIEVQAGICAYCGNADTLTIEHIIPVSRGGRHDVSNICLACPRCNYSKRDKLLEEWVDRWYRR